LHGTGGGQSALHKLAPRGRDVRAGLCTRSSKGAPVETGCGKMGIGEQNVPKDFPQGLKAALILLTLRHE